MITNQSVLKLITKNPNILKLNIWKKMLPVVIKVMKIKSKDNIINKFIKSISKWSFEDIKLRLISKSIFQRRVLIFKKYVF